MNNLEIPTNKRSLLAVTTSPSCSTFLPDEDTSNCPLLPNTSTPSPSMNFNDPLTPNILDNGDDNNINSYCLQTTANNTNNFSNVNNDDDDIDDKRTAAIAAAEDETSSCSGSSTGCIDGQVVAGTTTVFNPNVYQHLGKNDEIIPQSEAHLHAHLNLADSKDVPSFVYWNWKLIRKCSFFIFVASVIAIVAIVFAMIYTLPKTCNPKTVWYEGSVFYEIHPARFPDSNVDGFGDLHGLAHRVDYLTKLGVVGVRLNSIFPMRKPSNHFHNVTTLFEIDDVLGNRTDLINLVKIFHANNLSLILDLPIYPFLTKLDPVTSTTTTTTITSEENTRHPMMINNEQSDGGSVRIARVASSSEKNLIIRAINHWMDCGINGFYIKGIEHMHTDPLLLENIQAWKSHLGINRILMINNQLLEKVDKSIAEEIVKYVDLVDIFIDVTNGTKQIAQQINRNLHGILRPKLIGGDSGQGSAYIQWSIGGVSEFDDINIDNSHKSTYELTANGSLAATLMSLMLPGSPNIYHGNGNHAVRSREKFSEPVDSGHIMNGNAWNTLPQQQIKVFGKDNQNHSMRLNTDDFDTISQMIALRDISPSIYKNIIRKKDKYESNTSAMHHENGNILILMRWYPRRNTFVSISNFGNTKLSLDLTNYFYSGQIMIGAADKKREKIYFDHFEIGPSQTIVIKLDK